MPCAQSA